MEKECQIKRILQVGAGDFIHRGVEKILVDYYVNMDRSKVQFDFLTPGICKNNDLKNIIESLGGRIYELNIIASRSKIAKTIRFGKGLLKILRQENYDAVHVNTGSIYILSVVSFYSWLGHIKTRIAHSHNDGEINLKHRLLKAICTPFLKLFPTHYFACSISAGRFAFPKSKWEKVKVITNGINAERFTFDEQIRERIRNEYNISSSFVIGCVGAFTRQKNHSFLIDVFGEVYDLCKESVLMLIGAGKLEDDIREKVKQRNLGNAVIFVGTSNRVNELYQAMDCFVLPSIYEGLGIVTIEAQASGLKTLCSAAVPKETNVTELIDYMSVSEPVKKWAEKIISYKEKYLRENKLQEIKNAGYDIKMISEKLEHFYIENT